VDCCRSLCLPLPVLRACSSEADCLSVSTRPISSSYPPWEATPKTFLFTPNAIPPLRAASAASLPPRFSALGSVLQSQSFLTFFAVEASVLRDCLLPASFVASPNTPLNSRPPAAIAHFAPATMSFYNESSWPAAGRQPSWEQPQPPSRSGMQPTPTPPPEMGNNIRSGASSTVNRDEAVAFAAQFEGTHTFRRENESIGNVARRTLLTMRRGRPRCRKSDEERQVRFPAPGRSRTSRLHANEQWQPPVFRI
jgi:hypothetical protein